MMQVIKVYKNDKNILGCNRLNYFIDLKVQ